MNVWSHPFRFSGGKVAKVDDQSDSYAAQTIAAVIKTGKGELWLNPAYGTDSMEFSATDISGLMYSISAFHPYIRIDGIEQEILPDGSVKIRVEFTRL